VEELERRRGAPQSRALPLPLAPWWESAVHV
jgi:hypothetical protein